MRRVIQLGFCCSCTRVVWGHIEDNGQISFVEGQNIHEKDEPLNQLILVRDEDCPLRLTEHVSLEGKVYCLGGWIVFEILSDRCSTCIAMQAAGDQKVSYRDQKTQHTRAAALTPPADRNVVVDFKREAGHRGKPSHIRRPAQRIGATR